MRLLMVRVNIFSMILWLTLSAGVQAADKVAVSSYKDELIRLRLSPRITEQMAGFFEARGFPAAMIEELTQYCFFTVVIKNKSKKTVWLDLDQWRFFSGKQALHRIPRSQWPAKWEKMHIPLSAQSTFRWTLLPEKLDFQADESEGGNVILERTEKRFSLEARFAFGKSGKEGVQVARIDDLSCADAVAVKSP